MIIYRNNFVEFSEVTTSNVAATSLTAAGTATDYKDLMTARGVAYRAKGSSSWTRKKVTTSTLSANLTGLTAATTYEVCIYAQVDGEYQYGPIKEVTTEAAAEE